MTAVEDTTRTEDAPGEFLDQGWSTPMTIPVLDQADPAERIRAVARSEFGALAIPELFGGAGLSLLDVASAQRALARVDPGTAIAVNMHSLSIGVMVDYWKRHHDDSWMLLEGIANSKALVASAFAEPGGSPNFMKSVSQATPTAKGYLISGTKFPCSLATTAEIYCLSANVTGTGESVVGLCPAKSPGITVGAPWESVGMRGSDTARVVFDNVELDDRLVFHRAPPDDFDEVVVSGIVWFVTLVSATYHGVLTSLLEYAVAGARKRGAAVGGQRQLEIGRAARELYLLGSACRQLAHEWETTTMGERNGLAAAMALRAGLSATRERVVTALTPVLGAQLFTAGDAAAGLAIDSLAVHHHPPNLMSCDEAVGALHLGHPMSFNPTA
ncbi:acyl-CoA dehydrogenase family protein [Nocardia takedensis]|uniref:acyl-CoA dehydrogenase family protein n=1 Tax=Nocardia takedensis TaxID=259390 RepID=UPI0002DA66D4|nr:acyl-CoA dehydrogenase family protein [Nocardia takedensis]